jgi:hypothetical protein
MFILLDKKIGLIVEKQKALPLGYYEVKLYDGCSSVNFSKTFKMQIGFLLNLK